MAKKLCNMQNKFTLLFVVCIGFLLIIMGFFYSSFALVTPIQSISFTSEKLDYSKKEPGSWKVEKSAKWISKGKARITFDVDTILKAEDKNTNVIFVLDISESMNGEKLEKVKQDSIELVNTLLLDSNNQAALITFDTGSEILSDFTSDRDILVNIINNISTKGSTNYYQALVNVDQILKNYTPSENRNTIVLFLTDGYPNEDVPNEETQYQYLKQQYPYLVINGIQYEMGSEFLEPIKKVSDSQYIADMETLSNVLLDASIVPIPYEKFILTDMIDTDNFTLESVADIRVSQGRVEFNKEEQSVIWTIEPLRTGSKSTITIDIKQKNELIEKDGIYLTNKKEEVNSKIGDIEENITSNKTPILKDSYQVIYEENAPRGCTISNVPSTISYTVFDQVEIESNIPTCEGYQFKGWEIITPYVKRINSDYFEMPESDVILRAEWKSLFLSKSMNGEVYKYIPPVLQKIGNSSYKKELWQYKSSITKVVFQDEIRSIPEATQTFDISAEKNGGVMGYLVPNTEDTSTYTAYIQGDGGVIANQDSSYLFGNFIKLQSIEGLEYLDTSKVTNMDSMFESCSNLTSLDVSSFDTSNVTTMHEMFSSGGVSKSMKIANLDVSSFDTSKVTNMGYMFSFCSNLTSLDVSHFDTSKVINMSFMFSYCSSLISLDVSNFDTSNVTNISWMFSFCSNLTSLDLIHFDTSNVTNMDNMFSFCSSLTSLDLSHFDTSKVTNMRDMFSDCSSLTNLDLSSFDTSKVTNMQSMFEYCSSLPSLDLIHFDTSKVTNMYGMFSFCSSLTSLDLSSFNTSNVTNMGSMFRRCSNLTTSINIYNPSVSGYSNMFSDAATTSDAQIIINYIESTSNLVDQMIATKSSNSNVIKGTQIPKYSITVVGNDDIVANSLSAYANQLIQLSSASKNYIITSFKMNGTLVEGNEFIMPSSDVTITDIQTVEMAIIESEHNPYSNSLSSKVYGEKTFEGATSLTVTLDYQTESTNYDWIYLYDSSGKQYGKYGGKTRTTEIITIPGNYIKVVFRTDSSGNNYYGFKATVIPNYD